VDWVIHLTAMGGRADKRELGFLFYFWWHLWKERNRRIFDKKENSIPSLSGILQEDIAIYSRAMFSGTC
jgi:hypothetical protein